MLLNNPGYAVSPIPELMITFVFPRHRSSEPAARRSPPRALPENLATEDIRCSVGEGLSAVLGRIVRVAETVARIRAVVAASTLVANSSNAHKPPHWPMTLPSSSSRQFLLLTQGRFLHMGVHVARSSDAAAEETVEVGAADLLARDIWREDVELVDFGDFAVVAGSTDATVEVDGFGAVVVTVVAFFAATHKRGTGRDFGVHFTFGGLERLCLRGDLLGCHYK